MQKILSRKNLIEIWLLQIGEQFINKETAMKCLQSSTKFSDNTREKRTNREEISF